MMPQKPPHFSEQEILIEILWYHVGDTVQH
jgi:hypothetical protein